MLIVTIAALLMAASLAWFAYRLLQEEHRRSEARVAVLTAALDADPVWPSTPAAAGADRPWALARSPLSTAVNGSTRQRATHPPTPDIVLIEDDSRNIRAFRSEHAATDAPVPEPADQSDVLRVPPAAREAVHTSVVADVPTRDAGLFADVPTARAANTRGLLALVAVVLVGLVAAGYVLFGRTTTALVTPSSTTAAVPGPRTSAPAGVPLELVALTHTQERGALVVRGRVRNPVSGSDRAVVAHVALLDGAGLVVGGADAPLAGERLVAGHDGAFVARAAVGPDVRRYRVTFRDATGAPIAHVDRRAATR